MKTQAQPSFELKDTLFNQATIKELAQSIARVSCDFCPVAYQKLAMSRLQEFTLKGRLAWLAEALVPHLPDALPDALGILQKSLPPPLDPSRSDGDFGHFIWAVPAQYATHRGCQEHTLDIALAFLRECTQRFSAEFALRPFLKTYPEKTLAYVRQWSVDSNYHVRRLASEGIRPRLPWAEQVLIPEQKILDILENLYTDETEFVRRSVANNLNDLSKSQPERIIKQLKQWKKQGKLPKAELIKLIKHSLRTELKAGNPKAMALLDYSPKPKFKVRNIHFNTTIHLGERLEYQSTLTSQEDQQLMVTLNVYFLKANQTHHVKSYKVVDKYFKKNESVSLSKAIAFKPMTTRTLYAGTHYLQLQVNGQKRNRQPIELVI